MTELVTLRIFDSRIDQMVQPGGITNRWVRSLAREIELDAVARAPFRTGQLKASIRSSATPVPGPGVVGSVSVSVHYAQWVVHGTDELHSSPNWRRNPDRPFRKWRGWGRWAAGNSKMYPGQWRFPTDHWYVLQGQRPNPFLEEAMAVVLTSHRVI
jgi:hypothetical protein